MGHYRPRRPTTEAIIRTLVGKMAAANPLWGALRIHGELCKLGLDLSERTVSRLPRKPMPDSFWRRIAVSRLSKRRIQGSLGRVNRTDFQASWEAANEACCLAELGELFNPDGQHYERVTRLIFGPFERGREEGSVDSIGPVRELR